MNKILFTMLFASVSFSGIQNASAGKLDLEDKKARRVYSLCMKLAKVKLKSTGERRNFDLSVRNGVPKTAPVQREKMKEHNKSMFEKRVNKKNKATFLITGQGVFSVDKENNLNPLQLTKSKLLQAVN